VNTLWIVVALLVVAAVAALAPIWLRRDQRSDRADLGTVSHQWIAEQRLGHGSDRHR
jgi:hypothetical protein